MRSVLEKKKAAADIGFNELMYIILGLLVLGAILYLMFGQGWKDLVKSWLPSMNSSTEGNYNEISGEDEVIIGDHSDAVSSELSANLQNSVSYSRLAADVCTFMGYGGMLAGWLGTTGDANGMYRSAFSGQDFSQSGIGEIESVSLGVGTTAAVADMASGAIIGNIFEKAGRIYYGVSGAQNAITISRTGEVVNNLGKTIGVVSRGSTVNILLKGGSVPITTTTGEEGLIFLSKTKVPYYVASSSRAFSFLSKTLTVAGYATSAISVICDVSATFMSAYSAVKAANEYSRAQKNADDVLASVISDVNKKTEEMILKFYASKDALATEGVDTKQLALQIESLRGLKNAIIANYVKFSTNLDVKREEVTITPGTASPYSSMQGAIISQITDDEWKMLNAQIKNYVIQYEKVWAVFSGYDL